MFSTPSRPEIDHDTIKLLVGVIALILASVASFFSVNEISSVSASYHENGWARNFFVGFLFAISALMLSYNGYSRHEMISSKVAAIAAFGVAMFPCGCGDHEEVLPHIHYVSAAIMFSILAYFCQMFRKRARDKGHAEAMRRATIYGICGLIIVVSMFAMAIDSMPSAKLSELIPRLTFYCEQAALIAFGVSWLTASKSLPIISSSNERIHPFG